MSLRDLVRAFATVFPAELPDKTMVATIILVTRYRRPLWVWVGATGAFTVHVVVATAAGSAIGLLPDTLVSLVVTALFTTGSVLLFRTARAASAEAADAEELEQAALDPDGDARTRTATPTVTATVLGSFGLVVLAEWGDLTQLATASLAAASDSPASIGVGALLALASVAAIAATFGRQLVARVAIHKINYVGAAVFAALAVWTLLELLLG